MVLQKPSKWNDMNLNDKLRWYAKKDNDIKNIYADKYKIKFILKQMSLPGLHYAKTITHVKPIQSSSDLKFIVPYEMELEPRENQITAKNINDIIENVNSPEKFWAVLKEKYNIYPNNAINSPPSSYIYKLNLGWNTMIFINNNRIAKIVSGTKEFEPISDNIEKWKNYVVKHYVKKIPIKFFIEEFIGYDLKVYEIFCIYGKPRLCSVYYETSGAMFESNYTIKSSDESEDGKLNLELLKGHFLFEGSVELKHTINNDIVNQICDYAKKFASYFEFVRVDFYVHKKKIYFSECTFKPGNLKNIKWRYIGQVLSNCWTSKALA